MNKLLLITLLLFSAISFAQDKFIEVEVEDTISLEPERFEYVIKIFILDTSAVTIDGGISYAQAEKRAYAKKTEELKKLLKKKGYDFRPIEDKDSGEEDKSFYDTSGVVLDLKNAQELLGLQKLIENLGYVSGTFGDVKYANEQKAEEDLYKKLIEKAKAKADIIAKGSGLKACNVIAVRETQDMGSFEFNIHDVYFVVGDSRNLGMQNGKLTEIISKTLVVKFTAE